MRLVCFGINNNSVAYRKPYLAVNEYFFRANLGIPASRQLYCK